MRGEKSYFDPLEYLDFIYFSPESDPESLRKNHILVGGRGDGRGRKKQKGILFWGSWIHLLSFITKHQRVGGLKNKNVFPT